MTRPWIKVCGITRREDAQRAVALGVDALGFILVPGSPRRISPEAAARLVEGLPPEVARVGVFGNEAPDSVRRLVEAIGLSAVQAHGEESPEVCRAYGVPVVKAFPTGEDFTADGVEPYREFPILLDGFSPRVRGGTGTPADWEVARRLREDGYQVLLAGGLAPENVEAAVQRVEPVAVDLNSGIELEPGIKDAARMEAAVTKLKSIPKTEKTAWPW